MLVLGIETSCDETAAAVIEDGRRVRSDVVASQILVHAEYGGVVPEVASRQHLATVVPVLRGAVEKAGIGFTELDGIAVTCGPGLVGALLVGVEAAKALGYALGKPVVGVNHLAGHLAAVFLEQPALPGPPPYPHAALLVSGGHTALFRVNGPGEVIQLGATRDDAAGEAFDKVAKLLGLGYPGGPWIDALAVFGDPHAVPFSFAQIKSKAHLQGKAPRTKAARTAPIANLDTHFLFSFSGIKTAVLRYVELHHMREEAQARVARMLAMGRPPQTREAALALCPQATLDLIASFQHAVVGDLKKKTFAAAEALGASKILVTGGVAANRELRARFAAEAEGRGMRVAFPTLALSTDNAAMIAAAAWPRFVASEFAPASLSADPSLTLGS
jgi:tRNA N6-adenosine threonylcarbamoyltransferase